MLKIVKEHIVKPVYRWINLKFSIRGPVDYGNGFKVGFGTILNSPDRMVIGDSVSVGAYTTIACNGRIGNGVLISSNVGIVGRYDHDHKAIGKYISEAPWIYEPQARGRDARDEIIIEDDVWIGFGAIVLTGIKVGRGAIIAAGAVVVQDVNDYEIVAGNPARKIGLRFDSDEVKRHEKELQDD